MTPPEQIAKHLREVFFGGNWTDVNFKDALEGISWQHAVTKVHNLNTIALLVFHINYYVDVVLKVLEGQTLNASDKYSFNPEPITNGDDWNNLKHKFFTQAEQFAGQIEKMDPEKMSDIFVDPKYGTYFRNFFGIVEHTHYHLGQIVMLKKILNENSPG